MQNNIKNIISKINESDNFFYSKEKVIEILNNLLVPELNKEERRVISVTSNEVEFLIDPNKRIIIYNNKRYDKFSKKEFEIIYLLTEKYSKVVTMYQIFNTVWGSESDADYKTITVHMTKIKKKLGFNKYIKCQKRFGYKLEFE